MKSHKSEKNKLKRRVRFCLWCVMIIFIGTLAGIVILLGYTPRAYNPLPPDTSEQVSPYLTHQLGPAFNNNVQRGEPFELVITQRGINEIVSQWRWPQRMGDLSFSDPHIVFLDQSVILMGRLKHHKLSSVLSITTTPVINPNGEMTIDLRSVRLGMMPGTKLFSKLLQDNSGGISELLRNEPDAKEAVQAMISNQPFDPIFNFRKHRVRVTKITVEPGRLKVTLAPKPR